MADHEQQPSIPAEQQDDSAVALTTVGEPEQSIPVQAVPDRDHEAMDAEAGNLQQAAAAIANDEPAVSPPVDSQQALTATANDERVVSPPVDSEQDVTSTVNDITADIPMEDAQPILDEQTPQEPVSEEPITQEPVSEEPIAQEPISEQPTSEEQVMDPALVESVAPAPEEPIAALDETAVGESTEETKDFSAGEPLMQENKSDAVETIEQNETEDLNGGNAGDDSADGLFGSDDEAPKGTRPYLAREYFFSLATKLTSHSTGNGTSNENDDSEIEAISPTRPMASGEDAARGRTEDDDEEDEDMPMRKKQRADSPSASDGGNEHYARDVDTDRNDREQRQDEEDERTAAEPDENDEALGTSSVCRIRGTGLTHFASGISARKRALDARIEAIGKAGKRKRSRKKDDVSTIWPQIQRTHDRRLPPVSSMKPAIRARTLAWIDKLRR